MQIDFVPDTIQAPAQSFDSDAAYLAGPASTPPTQPPYDTTGWRVVPATLKDARNFTIEEYEEASEGFMRDGEQELAAMAIQRAWEMRKFLVLALGGNRN